MDKNTFFEEEGHKRLMDYVKAFKGYKFTSEGICFGLGHMGMQAILSNEVEVFDKRLNQLMAIKVNKIKDKVTAVRKKVVDKKTPLSEQDIFLLNLPAFFDGLVLYFQPDKFPHLFEAQARPFKQDGMLTAPLVVSHDIEKQGGLYNPVDFNGIYILNELERYFQSLLVSIKTTQLPHPPLALVLNNSNHSITIGCDGKNWMYIDANHMPTKYIPLENVKDIATKVHHAFFAKELTASVCFQTQIYMTKENSEKLFPVFAAWKAQPQWKLLHGVTKERAKRIDSSGVTWLHLATNMGDLAEVNALLAVKGIQPNQADEDGRTPLYVAAENNHLDVVNTLLAVKGIQPNQVSKDGTTPLYIAAHNGHLAVVNTLLAAKGIQLNQVRENGTTPLFIAAQNGHLAVVKALLAAKGIQPNQADYYGTTALFIAAFNGHLDVVNALLAVEEIQPNQADHDGTTPLNIAAFNGHLDVVNALLAVESIQPNQANYEGTTPLYGAAQEAHLAVVNALLAVEGIQLNQADHDGTTPLCIAAAKGHLDVVNALLAAKGIQPNQANEDGITPLYMAAFNSHLDVVNALLTVEGINPNKSYKDGITPLYIAAKKRHLKLVKAFLNAGVDPEITLELAKKRQLTIVEEIIIKARQELESEHKNKVLPKGYLTEEFTTKQKNKPKSY